MRYKIFKIVENFLGLQGKEKRKTDEKEQDFFKTVAEPHHFFAPDFFAAEQRERRKNKAPTCGAFFIPYFFMVHQPIFSNGNNKLFYHQTQC